MRKKSQLRSGKAYNHCSRKSTQLLIAKLVITNSDLQIKFPQGPYYNPQPLITIDTEKLEQLGEKEGTRKAFNEVNAAFSEVFNTSFTTTLVKHGREPIQIKPTANERKKKLREVYRKCRDKENKAR